MTSTGRINYIDELKGFILCLVCLGHIAYSELSYAMNWMSLMRMFTFFIPIRIIVLTKTISNVQGLCNK